MEEAENIRQELIKMLSCGGMKLHKWCSNHPDLKLNDTEMYPFDDTPEEKSVKTLVDCRGLLPATPLLIKFH